MRTDEATAAAVEASLEMAAERGGDLTPAVYARLFERHPAMESLFWRDREGGVRGEMLMRVFEAILDFVGERKYAAHLIQCEVITHAGYDVPPEVFAVFFAIVAEVVREVCGEAWTAQMQDAWDRTLAELDYYVTHPDQAAA
jgi:hemoglobin-like flavoprotein